MDKIAIISDIHGNVPALEAVLKDIRQRGIDLIYNLGDLVGKGAHSDLVIDQCREVCQVIVQGNWDDGVRNLEDNPIGAWYSAQIGAERLAYLAELPYVYDFWLSGKRVRLYHASQTSAYHRVFPSHPSEVLQAMFHNTEFTGFDQREPDIVGYGDIHSIYMLPVDKQKLLFNAGSVGNPLDITLASYAILSGNLDSQTPAAFSLDFVRVPYDIELAIEHARQVDLPDFEAYTIELRTGVYRAYQKKAQEPT